MQKSWPRRKRTVKKHIHVVVFAHRACPNESEAEGRSGTIFGALRALEVRAVLAEQRKRLK